MVWPVTRTTRTTVRRRPRRFKKRGRVAKVVRSYVRRTINSKEETKWLQANPPALGMSWNQNASPSRPDIASLSEIAQGAAPNQRIGNEIRLQRLNLNFLLQPSVNAAADHIRVIIFRYNVNQGSSPDLQVPVDMFAGYVSGFSDQTPTAVLNPYTTGRGGNKTYQILRDMIVEVNTFGGENNVPQQKVVRFSIPLKGMKVIFRDTAASAASLQSGGLYFMAISSKDVAATDHTIGRINYTLEYKDA